MVAALLIDTLPRAHLVMENNVFDRTALSFLLFCIGLISLAEFSIAASFLKTYKDYYLTDQLQLPHLVIQDSILPIQLRPCMSLHLSLPFSQTGSHCF